MVSRFGPDLVQILWSRPSGPILATIHCDFCHPEMDVCPGQDKNLFSLKISGPCRRCSHSSSPDLFTCVEMQVILPCGFGGSSLEVSRKGKVRLMYPTSLPLVALHSQEGIARVFSTYQAGQKKTNQRGMWHGFFSSLCSLVYKQQMAGDIPLCWGLVPVPCG
jgi:hypothetical protein